MEFGIAGAEGGGEFESLLAVGPIAEAMVAVIGEILFGDGSAVELLFEERLGFRERVEPGEDGPGGFTVEQALVELGLDVGRQR